MEFKVGDRVRLLVCQYGYPEGSIHSVLDVDGDKTLWIPGGGDGWEEYKRVCVSLDNVEFVSSTNQSNMNIKEQFVLALTPEPKKSFRKAGITNGDDLLTDEGQNIFLTWLLHSKYADEFKTQVVDGLLEDQKAA